MNRRGKKLFKISHEEKSLLVPGRRRRQAGGLVCHTDVWILIKDPRGAELGIKLLRAVEGKFRLVVLKLAWSCHHGIRPCLATGNVRPAKGESLIPRTGINMGQSATKLLSAARGYRLICPEVPDPVPAKKARANAL
jgi:hypothetical protein